MTLLLLSSFILCLVVIDTVITKATELTLDDVTAIVDQKFQYPIGDDRFRLTYKISKVVERGEKNLPRWLTYNESSSCLTGTPVVEDIGIYSLRLKAMCINPSATFCQERISRTFHINVIEPLKNAAASRGSNVFHLHAIGLAKHDGNASVKSTNQIPNQYIDLIKPTKHYKPDASKILKASADMLLTEPLHVGVPDFKIESKNASPCMGGVVSFFTSLLLHVEHELNNSAKASLINKLSNFISKDKDSIFLKQSKADLASLMSSNRHILTAGPGNVIESLTQSVDISWNVACGSFDQLADFTQVLQHNIDVGRISEELGYGVIAWYVYSDRPWSRRDKRNVHMKGKQTNTPSMSQPLPTTLSQGSLSQTTLATLSSHTISPSSISDSSSLSPSYSPISSALSVSLMSLSTPSIVSSYSLALTIASFSKLSIASFPFETLSSSKATLTLSSVSTVLVSLSISSTEESSQSSLASSVSPFVSVKSDFSSDISLFETSHLLPFSSILYSKPFTTLSLLTTAPEISTLNTTYVSLLPTYSLVSITIPMSFTTISFSIYSIVPSYMTPTYLTPNAVKSSKISLTSTFSDRSFISINLSNTIFETLTTLQSSESSLPLFISTSAYRLTNELSSTSAYTSLFSNIFQTFLKTSVTGTILYSLSRSNFTLLSTDIPLSGDTLVPSSVYTMETSSKLYLTRSSQVLSTTKFFVSSFLSSDTVEFRKSITSHSGSSKILTVSNTTLGTSISQSVFKAISTLPLVSFTKSSLSQTDISGFSIVSMMDEYTPSSVSLYSSPITVDKSLITSEFMYTSSYSDLDLPSYSLIDSFAVPVTTSFSPTDTSLTPPLLSTLSTAITSFKSLAEITSYLSTGLFSTYTTVLRSSSAIVSTKFDVSTSEVSSSVTLSSNLTSGLSSMIAPSFDTSSIISVDVSTESLRSSISDSSSIVTGLLSSNEALTLSLSTLRTSLLKSSKTSVMLSSEYSVPVISSVKPTESVILPSVSVISSVLPTASVMLSSVLVISSVTSSVSVILSTVYSVPVTSSVLPTVYSSIVTSTAIPDSPPVLQNSIDLLEVTVGRYYEYTIPDNTFNDTEDGTTRQLNLSITLLYGKPLPLGAWLMFNSTSQTLYGIPLKSDMESSDLEINSFILTAFDSKGQSVKDVINLSYKSEINVSHSIEVVFNTSYSEFIEDRTVLISIAQSMAKFYKDDSMEYFTFFNVKNGSVSITWANNTLFSETCLRNEIQDIYDKLIDTNGTFAAEFMTLLANYVPVSANLSFKGVCVLSPTTILPTPNSTKSQLQNTEEKMWIQIILPALIVILLIVIISLILLICCRHRRPNKDISPSHTPKFLEDRRPIIFPEELEMMDPSFKPYKPVILPSDYLVENPPAVPPHGRQAPPTYKPPPMDDDVFEVDDSLFPPPEATTSTSDPPPYRLPPPYFNPHRNV